jgi:adenylylsulfate kinase
MTTDLVWHHATVTRERRAILNGHKACVLWFTGLSGAGKSTLAHAVEEQLHQLGCRTFVLDGDNVRHGLSSNLGFSEADRKENIRRIGEVAKLMIEAGVITLTAFISPFRADREAVRNLVPHGEFLEIYCNTPIDVCEQRDPKGLYQLARSGLIPDFTGVSAPYEAPANPELVLKPAECSIPECVGLVMHLLRERGVIQG